jgi:hypothetical protein
MENVWDYLRGNKLSGLVWAGYEAMVEVCRKAWLFLINDPPRIASLQSEPGSGRVSEAKALVLNCK